MPTPKTSHRLDLVWGAIIGIVFMFLVYYAVQAYRMKNNVDLGHVVNSSVKYDTVKNGSYTLEIKSQNEVKIKEQNDLFDEKIKSNNERIGDLYVTLSIIVTLIVVLNIGVFYNARHDAKVKVEEYLSEHIGEYEKKAKEMNDNVKAMYDDTMQKTESIAMEYKTVMEAKRQTGIGQTQQKKVTIY